MTNPNTTPIRAERIELPGGCYFQQDPDGMFTLHTPSGVFCGGFYEPEAKRFAAAMNTPAQTPQALREALVIARAHMVRLGMDERHIDFDPIDEALSAAPMPVEPSDEEVAREILDSAEKFDEARLGDEIPCYDEKKIAAIIARHRQAAPVDPLQGGQTKPNEKLDV